MTKSSIALIIPYFGEPPEWTSLFFETVRRNNSIDFHFFTDIKFRDTVPTNVFIHEFSFSEYLDHVNQYLDFEFAPPNAYKLCDLRPLFGLIHFDVFKDYNFYGWTDMDILFGDIRAFYTDDILSRYEILSTHAHTISGHLALFKNTKRHREQYKKIYNWKQALQNPDFVGIDEHGITNSYLYSFWEKAYYKFGLKSPKALRNAVRKFKSRKMYLVEQYTTPFVNRPWIDGTLNSDQPSTWFYKDGTIKNARDGEKEFIYLHFMNFKSGQWRHDNSMAPWSNLDSFITANVADMDEGIVIDESGIYPMTRNNEKIKDNSGDSIHGKRRS